MADLPPIPKILPTPPVKTDAAQQPQPQIAKAPTAPPPSLSQVNIQISQQQADALADKLTRNPQTQLPKASEVVQLKTLPPSLATQIQTPQTAPTAVTNLNAQNLNQVPPVTVTETPAETLIALLKTAISNAAQPSVQNSFVPPQTIAQQTAPQPTLQFLTPNPDLTDVDTPQPLQRASESIAPFQTQSAQPLTPLQNLQVLTQDLQTPLPLKLPESFSAKIDLVTLPQPQITAAEDATQSARPDVQAKPSGITDSNIKIGQLSATLEGATPNALPVISFAQSDGTASSLYVLEHADETPLKDFSARVPIGSQIQITPNLNASEASTAQIQLQALPAQFSIFTPGQWPAMEEIQQALIRAVPQAAQAMNAMTPSPTQATQQFGNAVMFFVSAMRTGDLQNWMGERALDTLRQIGRGDLSTRLSAEGALMSRGEQAATGTTDWRSLPLPMLHEQQIDKVMLHYRHEDQNEDAEQAKGNKQTRFIFDLNLDRMGPVQLDGLFRPGEGPSHQGGRLDIILRTEENFSQAARQKMRELYANGLKQTEITGELSFQQDATHWVKINANPAASEHFAGDV